MNCKICGAELKRPGEICNNCMNKIMLEQESRNDNTRAYTIKRKFAIGYEIISKIESIGIAIFLIVILLSLGGDFFKMGLIAIPFFIIWGLAYLIYRKIKIGSEGCTFYNTKMVYTYRKLRKKSVTIGYRNIKEISYQVPVLGKNFNVGNLFIKTNTGNILKRNIFIDAVENIEETYVEIQKLLK